jgi:outer membrane protein assembly factor BamB
MRSRPRRYDVSKDSPEQAYFWPAIVALAFLLTCVVILAGSVAGHSVGLIYNPPAVADGELYVTSTDGHLYALDSDGAPRWTVNATAEITTPATVTDDSVLFGTATGRVLSVGQASGTVNWDQQVAGDSVGSVATDERHIYAGAGSQLVATDRDGRVDWRFSTDGFVAAPVVAGERGPYVAASRIQSRNGTLYALDRNGSVRWTHEANATIEQVAISDGTVYHTADGRVSATAANGTRLWTVELSEVMGQPSIGNGMVVVGTVSGRIAAIERGNVIWRYRTDLPVAPTLAGETVYATTGRGLIAVRNGTEQWTRDVGSTVLSPPTVGDHVYVGTQINRTYAIAPDGSFAWVNRYSTTTEDIPWADNDGNSEFWNPQGSMTRVVGPGGNVSYPEAAGSGRFGLLLATGVLVLSLIAFTYRYWWR